jgi:hypothetical protein
MPGSVDFNDWLIGWCKYDRTMKPVDPLSVPLVMRCPQHLTKWAVELTGVATQGSRIADVEIVARRTRDAERRLVDPLIGRDVPFPRSIEELTRSDAGMTTTNQANNQPRENPE